ncbi:MAG: hypothetical protein IV087_00510 [Acidovorax sp.]|nr:hypothetical protein [Acidovorax sp.]
MKAPTRWLLFTSALLVLIAYPVLFSHWTEARFRWAIANAADDNAVDCGQTSTRKDPRDVVECAQAAIAGRHAFKASFRQPALDAPGATGLASPASGQVRRIVYQGNPGGFCLYFCDHTIHTERCATPSIHVTSYAPEAQYWTIAVRCDANASNRTPVATGNL